MTFDPATHTYSVDGVVVPSVTQVLEEAGIIDYSHLPAGVREMALERGRAVHLATQYDDEGVLSKCPEWLAGYLEAWRAFRRNTEFRPELIEHRGFHKVYRYAGTLDRSGFAASRLVLLDVKTNEAPWWVRLQLAAYAAFFEKPRTQNRMSVELHSDGTYRIEAFDCKDWQQDFNDFLAALTVCNLKRRYMPERRAAA